MTAAHAFFQTDTATPASAQSRVARAADNTPNPSHRVVVVGGGFGGLRAVRSLERAPVQITLIDRRNFHLFQPLLYQVATGQLSPADIASPLRAVVGRQRNVTVLEGEVIDILPQEQRLLLGDGESVPYDTLVLSAGSTAHFFGRDDWAAHAKGLKSIEDATAMRNQILSMFEQAERATSLKQRHSLMTFVIVGGGPTGVELAGAIAELTQQTFRDEYRAIRPTDASILLIEGTDRVLPSYPVSLSEAARARLERLGVTVLTNTLIAELHPRSATLRQGDHVWDVSSHTVLWAAGVKASPLGNVVARRTGAKLARGGRLSVQPDCSLPGHSNIFVVGDMAHFAHGRDAPLPGVAPVALQQGAYAARLIRRRLQNKTSAPFRYRDWGSLAVIGRAAAVAKLGPLSFAGFFAWLLWLLVHIQQLIEFENRLLVFTQWLFSYLTGKRSARLITHPPPPERPAAD